MGRARPSGFTLIELMIVIAIIAVIAAIAIPNLLASRVGAYETSAVAEMRAIFMAQHQLSVTAAIDSNADGRGEYGTLFEMAGEVGVRRGYAAGPPAASDFSKKGNPINPALLADLRGKIDDQGYGVAKGYVFRLFLPDTASPPGFVNETGPAAAVALTGPVGVESSEMYWCCYAQPQIHGTTGSRRFFTSYKGTLLQSVNETGKGGTAVPIQANGAFLGDSISSAVASGTVGKDGDLWKLFQ